MAIITLTTDFGEKDHFAGATKGAIYSELPDVTIVDISHSVSPFNIPEAAYIIQNAYSSFPKGTIHIIGIDAEINPENKHIAIKLDEHYFICANNGIMSMICSEIAPEKIVARGNKIKAFGDEELLEEFDRRITMLLKHFGKYNKLDENVIERVLTSQSSDDYTTSKASGEVIVHGVGGKLIKAQTANQRKMVELMRKNDMVFAIGPAGTGKTYTGVALAVQALKNKEVKRIILTRPAVEAGENLGFLPGDLKEKLDPYMQPLYDALRDMIAPEKLAHYIENGTIQIAPLAFMRGRTLDNAFVILDEGQNTTHAQMKMFLTRMGKHAKFLLTGDPGQIDLPRRTISGLKEALLILKNVEGVGMIFLDDKDVIRHKLVKKVIAAYKNIENRD